MSWRFIFGFEMTEQRTSPYPDERERRWAALTLERALKKVESRTEITIRNLVELKTSVLEDKNASSMNLFNNCSWWQTTKLFSSPQYWAPWRISAHTFGFYGPQLYCFGSVSPFLAAGSCFQQRISDCVLPAQHHLVHLATAVDSCRYFPSELANWS